MKQIESNDHYKILKVEILAGGNMPRHFATSDAFIMVESGNALLVCKGETCELKRGSTVSIPSHEPHLLKVIEDFRAFVVLASNATINVTALQ
jgi:quercetin dioxygenase-like cupin family protein